MGRSPQPPQVPRPAAAERRLGNYVLEEHIGTGGMGLVFVARRLSDGERVALKVLNPSSIADAEAVARFRQEARFMLALDHPHIVKAFEVGTVEGQHYLIMEYVPGENLKQRILREGRLQPGGALRMMRQIADALDYGARRGVIHRDLKPENILIRADGVAKLADMGLAILANREDLRLTAPGFTLGTPEYMSPEQARAQRDIDTRSDVYSLGCTFYHAICARPPFEGANPILIVDQHLKDPPPPPSELVPGLGEGVEAILLRCMEKDRESRFQTCAELVQAIDGVVASLGPSVPARLAEGPSPAALRRAHDGGTELVERAAAAPEAPAGVEGSSAEATSPRAGPARLSSPKSARRRTSARRFEEAPPPASQPPVPKPKPVPPPPVPVLLRPPVVPEEAGRPPPAAGAGSPTRHSRFGDGARRAPSAVLGRPGGLRRAQSSRGRGLLLAKVLVVVILVAALALCVVLAALIASSRAHVPGAGRRRTGSRAH